MRPPQLSRSSFDFPAAACVCSTATIIPPPAGGPPPNCCAGTGCDGDEVPSEASSAHALKSCSAPATGLLVVSSPSGSSGCANRRLSGRPAVATLGTCPTQMMEASWSVRKHLSALAWAKVGLHTDPSPLRNPGPRYIRPELQPAPSQAAAVACLGSRPSRAPAQTTPPQQITACYHTRKHISGLRKESQWAGGMHWRYGSQRWPYLAVLQGNAQLPLHAQPHRHAQSKKTHRVRSSLPTRGEWVWRATEHEPREKQPLRSNKCLASQRRERCQASVLHVRRASAPSAAPPPAACMHPRPGHMDAGSRHSYGGRRTVWAHLRLPFKLHLGPSLHPAVRTSQPVVSSWRRRRGPRTIPYR